MPYIAVNTSQKLSDAQKDKIKAELGRLIAVIPTKSEVVTMVDISDARTIYKAGEKIDGAFVDLRLYKKSEFGAKKKYTEEIFGLLSGELGIKNENVYINIFELETWGADGTLK